MHDSMPYDPIQGQGCSYRGCPEENHSYHPKAPFTRYILLSNQLSGRFDNRLYRVYKHSTGCQTRLTNGCIVYTVGCQTSCTTRFDNRLNEQWLFVQHSCQTGCQPCLATGWTTGRMFVYIFLHDTVGCQTGCTTVLTTGCIVQTGYKFFSWHAVHCYVICSKSNYSGLS